MIRHFIFVLHVLLLSCGAGGKRSLADTNRVISSEASTEGFPTSITLTVESCEELLDLLRIVLVKGSNTDELGYGQQIRFADLKESQLKLLLKDERCFEGMQYTEVVKGIFKYPKLTLGPNEKSGNRFFEFTVEALDGPVPVNFYVLEDGTILDFEVGKDTKVKRNH